MPSRHDSSIHAPLADWGPRANDTVDVPEYFSCSEDARLSFGLRCRTRSAERDDLAPSVANPGSDQGHHQQPPPPKQTTRHSTSISTSTTTTSSSSTSTSLNLRVRRPSSSSSARPLLNRTLSTPVGSYFAPQPGSSGIEARSPANKRAPASRSSHGIETSSGPPPALSTQHSYSTDTAWRVQPPSDSAFAPYQVVRLGLVAGTGIRANTFSDNASRPHTPAGSLHECPNQEATEDRRRSRSSTWSDGAVMAATVDRYRGDILEDERDRTLRALEGIRDGGHVGTRYGENIGGLDGESERSLAGNEDLFLNLARATSTRQGPAESSSSRSERRRSRISLANHRQSPPQTEYSSPSTRHLSNGGSPVDQTPSPSQPQYTSEDRWQHQQQDQRSLTALHTPSPLQYRPSTKARSFAASAHPLDDSGRSRYFGVIPKSSFSIPRGHVKREISPESPQYNGRRSSPSDLANVHVPVRAHRQSNLSYSALRNQYPSPLANHITEMDRDQIPNTPRADGTESTVSTTAPSTVWDELDDMKSRIRKLELTGKLPPSSGAAISSASGERPRTATTTVTTISSSPKHGRGKSNSPPSSAIGGPGAASIHPLLHAALAKCKPLISSDVYRALEATASDSLSLAAMMGSGCPQGTMHSAVSVLGGSSIADRHVRRKADSMCRSLTELCIALSDDKSDLASPAINGSGCVRLNGEDRGSEQDVGASGSPYQRASSQEPAEHTNPRSIMSRLEARRTSILSLNSINGHRGQARDSSTPTQTPTGPSIPRRLSRAPTVLLGARRTEDTDDNSEARPLSRATTELGPSRSSPRERVSKEYTSRLTLPHQSSRSPSLQSSLPVRRNYLTNSQALSTPNIQPGSRRYLDRSTQPATDNGSRLAEARQQRIASAGQNNTSARQRRGSLDGSGSLVGRRLRQASAEPRVEEQAEGYQQR